MNQPLSIAILGVNYAPERSGIAPYTAGLAGGLRGLGHNVRVFTSFPHYPEWRRARLSAPPTLRERLQGVPVTRLRHYVPSRPYGVRRAIFEASFGARLVTTRWGGPDIVICVSPALISSAMAIGRGRLGGGRYALGLVMQDLYSRGVEENEVGSAPLRKLALAAESRVAGSVDGVVVIHDRFKKQLVAHLGIPEDRVDVIRNWTHIPAVPAVDVDTFRVTMGWRSGEVVVLHSGAMGAKQGLENVVEAARLADARGSSVRFVLMGDGSQRRALESAAAGIRSIQFLDHLDDAGFGQALRAADVLLVNERPGLFEMAVPSKLTSYFSSGRPVLAATQEGSTTADEITFSGAGTRVDPGSPIDLLNAAIELGDARERALELGANGLRYCASHLTQMAAVEKYDAWVRNLVAMHRSKRD